MPYTALMAAPPNSPVVKRQCELVKTILEERRIGRNAGPRLTLQAIRSCPEANVSRVPRQLIHTIIWHRRFRRLPDCIEPFEFHNEACGLMLVGLVIDKYRAVSEEQLMADPGVVGQALRKAFAA